MTKLSDAQILLNFMIVWWVPITPLLIFGGAWTLSGVVSDYNRHQEKLNDD